MDCIRCQGRLYQQPLVCGKPYCPIYSKIKLFKTQKLEKQDFLGTPPSVFVGRYNYPNINVGIISTPEHVNDSKIYDSPKSWSNNNVPIQDILDFRSVLINSRFKSSVNFNKHLEDAQLIALAEKPVDVEFNLYKKPHYNFKTSNIESPLGATAQLKQVKITQNIKISQKVEYVISDIDLKANQGLNILYNKGIDENFLSRILSIGTLGIKTDRKLVPTRWSITAVDDTVGKEKIKEIKNYPESNPTLFFGSLYGNYYLILLFPRKWSYELFESYLPNTLMNQESILQTTTDFEFYDGRKSYAENCVGGYYAARLAILDKLSEMHRQSSILVLRFISDEYSSPLGVWVCREAARAALKNKIEFSSADEMLKYAKLIILERFSIDIEQFYKQSKLIEFITKQKTLFDF